MENLSRQTVSLFWKFTVKYRRFLVLSVVSSLIMNAATVYIPFLSTIKQMDRIVVLEKGKTVEEGSHEMLLKLRQGTYQKLWQIQAGGFL